MTLDQYLTGNAIKGVDFAQLIEVSEASLTRIRRGEQNIGRDLIRRIVEATDGQVGAHELVFHGDHGTAVSPGEGGAATGQADGMSGQVAA